MSTWKWPVWVVLEHDRDDREDPVFVAAVFSTEGKAEAWVLKQQETRWPARMAEEGYDEDEVSEHLWWVVEAAVEVDGRLNEGKGVGE